MRKRKITSTVSGVSKCPKKAYAGPAQVVESIYWLYRYIAFFLSTCHPKVGPNLVLWAVLWNRPILAYIFGWEINIVVRRHKWHQHPPLRHRICLNWCANTREYICVLCYNHNRRLSPVFSKFLTFSSRLWYYCVLLYRSYFIMLFVLFVFFCPFCSF